MRLRPARPEDFVQMSILAQAAEVEGWSPESIASTAAPPLGRAWVVERGEGLRGFALARFVAAEAELLLIAVDAACRRGGVGRALWAALQAEGVERGVQTVHLEVASDNAAALEFYRRLGFTCSGRRAAYYGSGADAVLMRRPLAAR